MKVHEFKGFPNPARVRIALAEKGLFEQVEFVHVDVLAGEHREAAFLAKNPSGAVPVLELDDGTFISECTAITEYLDHLAGPPTLTGSNAKQRGIIHMMQRRVEAGFMDAVGSYFHHATEGLGPKLELYQNSSWGLNQRDRALATMSWLNELLRVRPYIAGDVFSVADITVIAALSFAEFAKIEISAGHTHLQAWRTRMSDRPSLAKAG